MTIKKVFFLLLLHLSAFAVAQQDTIAHLKTVFVADNTLKKFSN